MVERIMFWQIGAPWVFYLFAGIALGIFGFGLAVYLIVWRRSESKVSLELSSAGLKTALIDVFTGRKIFRGQVAAGIMHGLIFYGFSLLFLGTLALAVHHYIFSYLSGITYLVFSFIMEVAGLMLLLGLAWAAVRRYVQRVSRLERGLEDGVVLIWLGAVALSGFLLEAVRLAAQKPEWMHWSFFGAMFSGVFHGPAAGSAYPYLWWVHALLSLGFIAVIPFTKLFHMLGAPASIYLQNSAGSSPSSEDVDFQAFDLKDVVFFDACMRCGRCVEACPSAGAGEPFAPRDFVQAVRKALWLERSPVGDIRFLYRDAAEMPEEKVWYCTTCRACLEVCPIYGPTFEQVLRKRVEAIEEGTRVPQLLIQTLERLYKYNNPWESSRKKRAAWAKELDIVDITRSPEEAEICYFVGCTTSFDTRAQEIARSLTRILEITGTRFGILGKKEPCCGDIARRVGEVGLFEEQVEQCSELFEKYQISEVVTSSPHCFHTFANDYPGGQFRARHYTMLLDELIRTGRMKFQRPIHRKVTYHDPCYLGRHNRIFDEPRRVIKAVPGITFKEMAHCGPDSLCCGGGGGRMWQEELDSDVKMSEIRIKEAYDTGAEIVVTACPLCLIMLEDARKVQGLEDELKVMDLNELVLIAMGEKEEI